MSNFIEYHKDLTPEEYQYCIDNIDKEECKIKLFYSHIKLAIKITNKFKNRANIIYSYEDMESSAMYGLWHAIERFDPTKGYKLSSYIYPAISRSILENLRNMKNDIDTISMNVTIDDSELNLIDTVKVHNDDYIGESILEEIIESGVVFHNNETDKYVAKRILLDEAKQITVANELNVSRQAINIRLCRIRKKIKKYITDKKIDIKGD